MGIQDERDGGRNLGQALGYKGIPDLGAVPGGYNVAPLDIQGLLALRRATSRGGGRSVLAHDPGARRAAGPRD